MGAAAETLADRILVTSDNPRDEAPQAIIGQIVAGLKRPHAAHIEADRALAIARALTQSAPEDVVLIAGKGHEDYQETAGVRQPFSDQMHARRALQARAARAGAAA